MIKKHKLYSFLGIAASATILPIVAVACGGNSTTPGTMDTGTVKNTANKNQAFADIDGTAGQVSNVYNNALAAITEVLNKETTGTGTATAPAEKAALMTLHTDLKMVADTMTATTGSIRVKIAELGRLSVAGTEYPTKLAEIRQMLLTNVTNAENAYVKFARALNTSAVEATSKTEFSNIRQLPRLFPDQPKIVIQNPQLLDLARLYESFQGIVRSSLVAKYDLTEGSGNAKAKELGKTVAQIFNLLTKRELQTVIIAELFQRRDVTAAALATSFKKEEKLVTYRKGIATLPEAFKTLVTGLEAKITTLKNANMAVQMKKDVTGITALSEDAKRELATLAANVTQIEKRYLGFMEGEAFMGPGFARPGLKANVSGLDTELKALPEAKIETVAQFNDWYLKASPTWQRSLAMRANVDTSRNLIVGSIDTLTKLNAAITGTNTQDMELKTELTNVNTALQALKTDFDVLAAREDNLNSAWKLNENIRPISSLVQIMALQAAVDAFSLNAEDYALGPVVRPMS